MARELLVNVDAVGDTANRLDNIKNELSDLLKRSKQTIDDLTAQNIWEGEAANKTREAYEGFANKYFQNYESVIGAHISFLRTSVQSGYWDTESHNVGIGAQFN